MARITDPDDLRLSSQSAGAVPDGEVFIDTTTTPPTIALYSTTEFAGSNFTAAEGVNLQALYSFLKEQWKNNDTDQFYRYQFPMEAITAEQFEFINDWEPTDDTTRSYIRTGGWSEKDSSQVEKQAWMGVITLGTIGATQTAYYAWYDPGTTSFLTNPTDFGFSGPVNEPVKIFGNVSNGNFNYKDKQLFVYIRPAPEGTSGNVTGYTFDLSSTDAIGSGAGVTTQVYRFPLATTVDLNISLTDAEAGSTETATGLQILFDQVSLSSTQLPIQLAGGTFNFTHVIQSSNGDSESLTPTEVYNVIQYKLRQDENTDIDEGAGTRIGLLTEELLTYVGSQLQTFAINGGTEGVLIDNFDQTDTANFAFRDDTNTLRSFPTIASGTLTFSTTLQDDPSTRYWMFYTSASSGAWPGANAVIVDNYNGTDIAGYLHSSPATGLSGSQSGTAGATVSGSSAFVVTGDSWSANELAGKVLRVTSASSGGFYFISSNTSDTITIDGSFENSAASQVYEIYNKNTSPISWTFDYGANSTRNDGKTGDAPITIVALGLDNAQYIVTSGTIGSGTGQNFPVSAALERNYSDPV